MWYQDEEGPVVAEAGLANSAASLPEKDEHVNVLEDNSNCISEASALKSGSAFGFAKYCGERKEQLQNKADQIKSNKNNFLDVPHNLYWVIPGKLIGMGCPMKRKHIENLHNCYQVKMVVNLRECGTPPQMFDTTPVRNIHIPIKGFCVPTKAQVQLFIQYLEQVIDDKEDHATNEEPGRGGEQDNSEGNCKGGNGEENSDHNHYVTNPEESNTFTTVPSLPNTTFYKTGCTAQQHTAAAQRKEDENSAVAVNCRGGKGRTGTMVCCYLIHKEGITAREAIERVRSLSAGSIETKGQEEFIEEFYKEKMVKEGKGAEYTRSLLHPPPATAIASSSAVGPTTTTSASSSTSTVVAQQGKKPECGGASSKGEPRANSKGIVWNRSHTITKMYK